MRISSKLESTEYTDLNKVIGWFITLRWLAWFGVLIALIVINFTYHDELSYHILYSLNGLLFLVNLSFTIYYHVFKQRNLSRKEMGIFFNVQVCSDYAILFLLIYYTGFLENPFSYYFVFHIMLTSFIFSPMVIFIYVSTLVSLFIAVSLAEFYQLIPHFYLNIATISSSYYDLVFIRAIGLCSTLIITAYLINSIKIRIEERGKKVEVELTRYKSLDKVKSNFILQVTHELRGPLAALKGYHEMILKEITGKIEPRTRETLQRADRRTENLLTIIDEMIDFAYMKSEEEVRYDKTDIRLKAIIDYDIDLFDNRARQRNIQFVSSCPKDLTISANRDLLNIILSNLITNALRYSPAGKTITINAMEDNNRIHILVKDEGMGIKPEELPSIFEEFYRSQRAREIEKDGTGLGLPIVKRAVEVLNGKITVYSEVDKGSSFHIYLPKKNSKKDKEEGHG